MFYTTLFVFAILCVELTCFATFSPGNNDSGEKNYNLQSKKSKIIVHKPRKPEIISHVLAQPIKDSLVYLGKIPKMLYKKYKTKSMKSTTPQ
ncbi:hypothetical protein ACQ4LE_007504 [Meloidogyne hapla]